jgi:hypothetical protein
VLVIVENRNVQLLAQARFDFKAARRGDVLQIDAAEGRGNRFHRADDFLDILRVQANRERVHVRELLEQDGFALHDRHRCQRTDVAQTQHCRAVRHDCDEVALRGVTVDVSRICMNAAAGLGNAGRVGGGQVITVLDLDLAANGDLAVMGFVHFKCCLIIIHLLINSSARCLKRGQGQSVRPETPL